MVSGAAALNVELAAERMADKIAEILGDNLDELRNFFDRAEDLL